MSNYMTHPIDNTPTIRGVAGADIETPALLAVKFNDEGKMVLPAAGDPIIGIVLADENSVKAGNPLHVQIKDITYWIAGDEIKAGNMLKATAEGKCEPAAAGDVVNAIALEPAAAGDLCKVMITHTTVPAAPEATADPA